MVRNKDTCLIIQYYLKYRNIILFNKNIFISAIITGLIDIWIVNQATVTYPNNYFLVSIISLIVDFAVYNSMFVILFFTDNRKRYINSDGSKNKPRIVEDSRKLLTALGLAEVGYLITKFFSTYVILMAIFIEASLVSIMTTLLAWIIYITCANLMMRKQQFF
jgi:hypothetical protein